MSLSLTCELAVVVGAGRVLLVGAERGAGGGAGAEAGVSQRGAHFAGLAAVGDRPLHVQGRRQRGALLGLDTRQKKRGTLWREGPLSYSVLSN